MSDPRLVRMDAETLNRIDNALRHYSDSYTATQVTAAYSEGITEEEARIIAGGKLDDDGGVDSFKRAYAKLRAAFTQEDS